MKEKKAQLSQPHFFEWNLVLEEENIMQIDSGFLKYAADTALDHQEDDEDIGKHAQWQNEFTRRHLRNMKILDIHHLHWQILPIPTEPERNNVSSDS